MAGLLVIGGTGDSFVRFLRNLAGEDLKGEPDTTLGCRDLRARRSRCKCVD